MISNFALIMIGFNFLSIFTNTQKLQKKKNHVSKSLYYISYDEDDLQIWLIMTHEKIIIRVIIVWLLWQPSKRNRLTKKSSIRWAFIIVEQKLTKILKMWLKATVNITIVEVNNILSMNPIPNN